MRHAGNVKDEKMEEVDIVGKRTDTHESMMRGCQGFALVVVVVLFVPPRIFGESGQRDKTYINRVRDEDRENQAYRDRYTDEWIQRQLNTDMQT